MIYIYVTIILLIIYNYIININIKYSYIIITYNQYLKLLFKLINDIYLCYYNIINNI